MKSIKLKLSEMLEAKVADGINFKTELDSILGESTLTESVKADFIDVMESLVIKMGSDLATELVESVELELTEETVKLEESAERYSEYVTAHLDENAEAYGEFLTEKAEAYVDFIDNAVLEFQESMDEKANAYAEYVTENMNEMVESKMSDTQDKLDKYIDFVAESYVTENKLPIETSIKESLVESLVGDLRVVFEKHNLELPDAINVVDELQEDLTESESTIDKLLDKVNALQEQLSETNRQLHFNESTKDLTLSQKERVSNIVEKLTLSEEQYADKLESICEMVKSKHGFTQTNLANDGHENYQVISEGQETTVVTEEKSQDQKHIDKDMQAYIAAAANFAK